MAQGTGRTLIGVRFDKSGDEKNMDFFDKSTGQSVMTLKNATSVAADEAEIYVAKHGNDTTGMGTIESPVLTVTEAFTQVTSTRKNVIVFPGTYEEAAGLTWPTVSGTKLLALAGIPWTTEISIATGVADQVINVAPGAVSSTFEMWISNLRINHDESGMDGILLNNTSMTKKLNCYLAAVGGDADSDSDKFITVTHGDTSNAVRIYWSGPRNGEVDGAIYLQAKDAGDRIYINNAHLIGGVEFSTDAVAATLRIENCRIKHEGITGGNAASVGVSINSHSITGTTFAAVDTNEFGGNWSGETIV